jgi:hypothetical protein
MASTQSSFRSLAQDTPFYSIPDGNILSIARRFPYRKLEGRTKIRLLKLFPECHESLASKVLGRKLHETDLFGTLIEVDLDGLPSYECLSYTWGRSDPSCVLWLDESMIPISDNLDLALRCLQLEDQPRLLWVDFVCINQMDLHERKNQVQLMHDIFSNAKKVVAYLGHEADGSERIPELLTKICSAHDLAMDANLKKMHCTPWALSHCDLPPSEDALWQALRKFLTRPWFFRVWILQEALAAKKLDIMCGTWIASAEFVFTALILSICHRFPGSTFSLELNMPWEDENIRGCSQVTLMHELGICNWIFQSLGKEPKQWSLIEVLERSRYASASDPRDRVFALLNLCKEGKDGGFQPDYTETVRETFIRTAEFLISSGQGAKVLLNAFLSDPSLTLPSWVPDWSFSSFPSENPAPAATAYNLSAIPAAGASASDLRLGKLQGQILVSAFRISEIESLGCVHKYRYNRPFHMMELVHEALQFLDNNQPHEHAKDQKRHSNSHSRADSGTLTNLEPQSATIQASQTNKRKGGPSSLTDRSDWPPLYFIMEEISCSLKSSSQYAEQDHGNIIWRTMVCSHQSESHMETREDYSDSYKSFVDITRCQYEPGYLVEKVKRVVAMVESESPPNNESTRDEHSLLAFWRYFGDMNLGAEKFHSEARRFCFHMRVATTKTGHVGMVPQQARAGDIVVVIKGVSVPMIIRRSKAEEESFILVGQAYFYGFMQGEVFLNMDDYEEEIITLV